MLFLGFVVGVAVTILAVIIYSIKNKDIQYVGFKKPD